MTYEEWDAHTTELQNRYGYKGAAPSAGALAKVSIYEFVNDWVRPEISWKIFSYLGDPHKTAIKKNKTHRRIHRPPSALYKRRGKWFWEGRYVSVGGEQRSTRPERSRQYLYRELGQPYGRVDIREFITLYTKKYTFDPSNSLRDSDITRSKLKHTNPLLHELWSLHASKINPSGNRKFLVTKNKIKEILKINKVSGRTDLVFGVKCSEAWADMSYIISRPNNGWVEVTQPPHSRREVVGVLMKM